MSSLQAKSGNISLECLEIKLFKLDNLSKRMLLLVFSNKNCKYHRKISTFHISIFPINPNKNEHPPSPVVKPQCSSHHYQRKQTLCFIFLLAGKSCKTQVMESVHKGKIANKQQFCGKECNIGWKKVEEMHGERGELFYVHRDRTL